jgi:MFS transporter, SP family, general alpha glucoside:H+ symporter
MMNPDNGNLRGKTGFIFAAFSSVFVVWAYFRLPETADRSFEELDIMFHNKVPTRRFASYAVELPLPDDVVTVTVATADSNEKGNV